MAQVDHIAQARERLAIQYKEADKFGRLIDEFMTQFNALEDICQQLADERTLDAATGATLDIIGDIVGVPRTIFDVSDYGFFGFAEDPDPGTLGFGDKSDPTIGGIWYNGSAATARPMNDDEYRLKIRAKIISNGSSGSIQDICSCISLLMPLVVNPDWDSSVTYSKGQRVKSGALNYASKTDGNLNNAVSSSTNWLPITESAAVREVPRYETWADATYYAVGQYIKYSGNDYKCTTAHTSSGSFDSSKFASNPGVAGNWQASPTGGVYYPAGLVVQYDGNYYISRRITKGDQPDTTPDAWTLVTTYLVVFIPRLLTSGEYLYLNDSSIIPVPAGVSVTYLGYLN